jgi:hypothetical protein
MIQPNRPSKIKMMIFQFLFGGLFAAIINWANDVSQGGSFDLLKFLVRIPIYGTGMVLAFYIGGLVGNKKSENENK